jgi:hypothetical protein
VRVLGVNCSSGCAYVAVAVDGEIRDVGVEQIDAGAIGESESDLVRALADVVRVIAEVEADAIALLKPESGPKSKRTHAAFVPRIALETVVRLAAAQTGTQIEVLSRPTVRGRLKLQSKGKLVEHVPSRIGTKVGKNWSDERQLAALAALAALAGEHDS